MDTSKINQVSLTMARSFLEEQRNQINEPRLMTSHTGGRHHLHVPVSWALIEIYTVCITRTPEHTANEQFYKPDLKPMNELQTNEKQRRNLKLSQLSLIIIACSIYIGITVTVYFGTYYYYYNSLTWRIGDVLYINSYT